MTTETIETNEVESTEIDAVQTLIALPPKKTVLDVFVNKENEIGFIVEQVKKYYEGVDKDTSTEEKRKAYSAEAKKIKTAISRLKEMRLEETRRLQELPKIMISNNKILEELLLDFHDEFRKPLTDFEAKEKRIADEKKAKKKAEELKKEIERCHEEALQMNELFDLKREQEKVKAEQEQKEAAEKLQREAEEKARAEAKYQADLAIQKAENERLLAKQEAVEAERKAQAAIDEANKKAQEEIDRLKKEQEDAEKARLAKEEADKKAEEARKANIEHQRTINRAILAKLEELGVDSETATVLLKAMVKGGIPNVTVNY